jgi:hypothetical protein
LLLELIPSGANPFLSASQAWVALLAKVRPRDAASKTGRRVAAEIITDLERIYQRTKAADKQLGELLTHTGTKLMDLHGITPTGVARILVEVGDIIRFPGTSCSTGDWRWSCCRPSSDSSPYCGYGATAAAAAGAQMDPYSRPSRRYGLCRPAHFLDQARRRSSGLGVAQYPLPLGTQLPIAATAAPTPTLFALTVVAAA